MKIKYNLTIWQKLGLPFLWLLWATADPDNKKTWHQVKKGIEKHEHDYSIRQIEDGITYYQCSHEGCNMCDVDL